MKWRLYNDGADIDAVSWLADRPMPTPTRPPPSTARQMAAPTGAVNFNMGTLVGSLRGGGAHARRMRHRARHQRASCWCSTISRIGLEQFGQRIQPLTMKSRVAA